MGGWRIGCLSGTDLCLSRTDLGLSGTDLGPHGLEGAVEVGLDGVDGDAGDGGDLGEFEFLGEAHEEDVALIGGEIEQSSLDLSGLLLDEEAGLGGAFVAGKEVGGVGDVDGGGAGLTPEAELLEALLVADEIDGDAGEPGVDGAVAAEAVAGVVGLEEAVLGDGLGEVGVTDGEGDEAEQPGPVGADQGLHVVELRGGALGGGEIRDGCVKGQLHIVGDVRPSSTDYILDEDCAGKVARRRSGPERWGDVGGGLNGRGGGIGGGQGSGSGILLNEVLVHEDGDECGGGDCDEGADDAGQLRTDEQGDEHGEAHEMDTAAHDAGDEEAVFDLQVDGVEDEDAGHAGPGFGGRDDGREGDGDDAAGDGNDVEEAHEDAQKEEVTDVQSGEDDGAAEAEDEHEGELAEEPAAHAQFGDDEGSGQTLAGFGLDEGEQVVVDELAFEHEVDAEDERGDEGEETADPERGGGQHVLGGGGDDVFAFGGEGVEAELVGQGQALEVVDEAGDTAGKFGGEVLNVMHDRRQGEDEEEGEGDEDGEHQGNDRQGTRGRPVADAQTHDVLHHGHEDDGEESADVDQLQDR